MIAFAVFIAASVFSDGLPFVFYRSKIVLALEFVVIRHNTVRINVSVRASIDVFALTSTSHNYQIVLDFVVLLSFAERDA